MNYAVVPLETERTGSALIGAAIEVHRHLGPGFLERIYEEALCLELAARKLAFEREKSVQVNYKGVNIPGQRIDLIVGGCVVVELKAVATLHEVHEAKVISYLKTTGLRLGYLLNFHHTTMKEASRESSCKRDENGFVRFNFVNFVPFVAHSSSCSSWLSSAQIFARCSLELMFCVRNPETLC